MPPGRTGEAFPARYRFRTAQKFPRLIVLASICAVIALSAQAQTPQPILTNPVPQGSPIPRMLPPASPPVSPLGIEQLPSSSSGPASGVPVRISQVSVEGVTVYSPAEITAMTQDLAGHTVPFSTIDSVRLEIAQRYRGDGYVLSTVSASYDAPTGRLRFLVTEGHIASVKLDGDIGPAATQVLRFLNRLTEQPVTDAATLERYLLLAQDVPGVTLHAVLQASQDQPGALNLIAQVSRQAVSGLVATDNRASQFTGPIETLAGLSFNSFTEFGEKSEISLYHAWPNSQTFGPPSSKIFPAAASDSNAASTAWATSPT